MSEINYIPANVLQQSPSHAPILSMGHITLTAIHVFENTCRHYFQTKKVDEVDCVQAILYNFELSPLQSWVNANHA